MHHYVDQAVEAQDLSTVERVGIDETSSRRGHEYVSVFADLDEHRGVFCVEGRDHATVQAFSLFLETHGGDPGPGLGGLPGHVRGVLEGHPDVSAQGGDHV